MTRLVLGLLVLLRAPPVSANPAEDAQKMAVLVRDLRYEEAVSRGLSALRAFHAGFQAARPLAPVYRELAVAYYLLGDEPRAGRAFASALSLDADVRIPSEHGPKARGFFDDRKRAFFQVALDHTPPARVAAGQPLELVARIAGVGARADRVVAQVRLSEEQTYLPIRMNREGDRFVGRVATPAAFEPGAAIEYVLEARAGDIPLATFGTEAAPERVPLYAPATSLVVPPPPLPPPPPPPPATASRTWLWAGLAVLAAGVVTGIVVAARGSEARGPGMMPPGPGGLDVCVRFDDRPCR